MLGSKLLVVDEVVLPICEGWGVWGGGDPLLK